MPRPIYFDYMATTPVDKRVLEKMNHYMMVEGQFGNPASNTHGYGLDAMKAVNEARKSVASVIGAKPNEIIWTSGATESDNLAIIGAARFYARKGKHIVTVKTEHKAVLDTCQYLESEGFEITYLTPCSNGLLDMGELEAALRADTILVSIMHANNEIGVIQDIQTIGHLLRSRGGILFHVDAAQSTGKLPIDVEAMNIDLLSISGHKIYGPKGIGALFVRTKPKVRLMPLIHGGGHELGMRSGTLATHQIVGLAEALLIAQEEMAAESVRLTHLRDKLWQAIQPLPGIQLNGDLSKRLPNNLNISIAGIDGEALLLALAGQLAVSATSACSSASLTPSYVLKSLGLSDELAHSAVRLSLGRYTKEADIDVAIQVINEQVLRLRALTPC